MVLYYGMIIEVYRADTRGDLKSCNKNYCRHVSSLYFTPHTLNNVNVRYFVITHILFYCSIVNLNSISIVTPTRCTISQICFILEQQSICFGRSLRPSSESKTVHTASYHIGSVAAC